MSKRPDIKSLLARASAHGRRRRGRPKSEVRVLLEAETTESLEKVAPAALAEELTRAGYHMMSEDGDKRPLTEAAVASIIARIKADRKDTP